MNLHITKSKNAESFYIAISYVKANGSTTIHYKESNENHSKKE